MLSVKRTTLLNHHPLSLKDPPPSFPTICLFQNIDKKLSIRFKRPFTLCRHSGMLLAGIYLNQRPKTWIPANNMPE